MKNKCILNFTQEGGTTAAPVLRHVEVEIIEQPTCASAYSWVNTVTDGMVCAGVPDGGRDACQVIIPQLLSPVTYPYNEMPL